MGTRREDPKKDGYVPYSGNQTIFLNKMCVHNSISFPDLQMTLLQCHLKTNKVQSILLKLAVHNPKYVSTESGVSQAVHSKTYKGTIVLMLC